MALLNTIYKKRNLITLKVYLKSIRGFLSLNKNRCFFSGKEIIFEKLANRSPIQRRPGACSKKGGSLITTFFNIKSNHCKFFCLIHPRMTVHDLIV
jgi:hypothetical protein